MFFPLKKKRALQNNSLIAEFIGYCRTPKYAFLTRLYPGGTLLDLMKNENVNITLQSVLHFALQIAQIMNSLHSNQPPFIYKDLKPQNLMVSPKNVLKNKTQFFTKTKKLDENNSLRLYEFGFARIFKESPENGDSSNNRGPITIYSAPVTYSISFFFQKTKM